MNTHNVSFEQSQEHLIDVIPRAMKDSTILQRNVILMQRTDREYIKVNGYTHVIPPFCTREATFTTSTSL